MVEDEYHVSQEGVREPDPEPLSILVEIFNLVIQPGTLAAIVGGVGAAAQAIVTYKDMNDRKRSDIRRHLYEIDRALTKGFSGLMTLTSLLDQFNYINTQKSIGGAPITGFKNSETLRRTHEDCRSAVKEARDAFINLSALLPSEHSERIQVALRRLNQLSEPAINVGIPYGISLVAIALALTEVDSFISDIGERYDFRRQSRNFHDQLLQSFPILPRNDLSF